MNSFNSRLAPTPSGFLHIGNAFNFILTWILVRKTKGKLHLRIDDIDGVRTRDEYLDDIFDSLKWLDLNWDTGPKNKTEFKQSFSQLEKIPSYLNFIDPLVREEMTYYCECSRKKIKEDFPEGVYQGTCRDKKLEKNKCALRLKVDDEDLLKEMGDFVLVKKDGAPSYQVVSLIDDIEGQVNLIVRGEDLLPSTKAQIYLANLLGEEGFGEYTFIHHKLLLDDNGEKLSKSSGSTSLKQMREKGIGPEKIFQSVAKFLGLPGEVKNKEELLMVEIDLDRWICDQGH